MKINLMTEKNPLIVEIKTINETEKFYFSTSKNRNMPLGIYATCEILYKNKKIIDLEIYKPTLEDPEENNFLIDKIKNNRKIKSLITRELNKYLKEKPF
jgi:hypothetical protein